MNLIEGMPMFSVFSMEWKARSTVEVGFRKMLRISAERNMIKRWPKTNETMTSSIKDFINIIR